MSAAESAVAYASLDDKGRLPLNKPLRQALKLSAGSTIALVKVGGALMVIPQDAHLVDLMENATQALERAHISVDDLMDGLPEARAEVVVEHYGEEFLRELECVAQGQTTGGVES